MILGLTMVTRLLLLLLALFYLADGGGYQTYNGHGKGYGDYKPGKYPAPSYTYGQKPRRVSSSFPSYEYPFGQISSRPAYSSRPSLSSSRPSSSRGSSSYDSHEKALRRTSSRSSARSYTPPSSYRKHNYGTFQKSPYPNYDKIDYGKRGYLKTGSGKRDYLKKDYRKEAAYSKPDYWKEDYKNPEYPSRGNGRRSYDNNVYGKAYTKSPSRKAKRYFEGDFDESSPGRANYFPMQNYNEFSSPYLGVESKPKYLVGGKTFYGKSEPKGTMFLDEDQPSFRRADPCIWLDEGEYVLDKRFHDLFDSVDPQCYFIKCANKKAYLNPCSKATRNTKDGEGFCSTIDLEGFCGPSFHDLHKPKRTSSDGNPKRY